MHINIGKLIKQEMIRQGLKPGELAERIWVTRTNIYSIFERKSIDTELLERICDALHTNFFTPMAEEISLKVGDNNPSDALDEVNMLSYQVMGDDLQYFTTEDIEEGFQEVKRLVISLLVNGSGFDEVIDLPQELFPLLTYAYDCAMEGPLKGKSDEEIDSLLFPWLEIHHPKLTSAIKDAVNEMLLERIAADVEGEYRDYIDYNEPTSIDEWFSLGKNDIQYFIDDLHERIQTVKRPLRWKQKSI